MKNITYKKINKNEIEEVIERTKTERNIYNIERLKEEKARHTKELDKINLILKAKENK